MKRRKRAPSSAGRAVKRRTGEAPAARGGERLLAAALEVPGAAADERPSIAIVFLDPADPGRFHGVPHLVDAITSATVAAAWREVVAERARAGLSPPRVRCADELLAAALRGLGEGEDDDDDHAPAPTPAPAVEVGPTPEIDALREILQEVAVVGVPPSYFHGQPIPPALVRELFAAAVVFRRAAPWETFSAEEWLDLDIAALGVEEAVVAVITDEGLGGLQIFPDAAEVARVFADASADPRRARRGTIAVMFYPRAQLPPSIRPELRRLPFAPATGPIPVLVACDDDGRSRPLGRRDYQVAIAALVAVAGFVDEHRDSLDTEECEAIDDEIVVGCAGEAITVDLGVHFADAGTHGEGLEGVGPRPSVRSVHRLKVAVSGARPPIWRRLEVASAITLGELHDVLQAAMGWRDELDHFFRHQGRDVGPLEREGSHDERLTELWALVPEAGGVLHYFYDDGAWELEVTVEEVHEGPSPEPRPRCLDGRRAGPPEHGGGSWALEDFLSSGPPTDEPESPWLGWDPRAFAVDEVNGRLQREFGRAALVEAARPRLHS